MAETRSTYGFRDAVPLNPVSPGTSLLVTGPIHDGTRELCLAMTVGEHQEQEGTVFITTTDKASRLCADCEALGARFDPERTGIVDSVDDERVDSVPARVMTVSSPGDLTGIGMRFSRLSRDLHRAGYDRIRTGVITLTTLLTFAELKTVSRFTHTLTGRVEQLDGLGTFLLDPSAHPDQVVGTLSQFFDARIDVRLGEEGTELRCRGLRDQPGTWTRFDL